MASALYHLLPADRWAALKGRPEYESPSFQQDGFIRLSASPQALLEAANADTRGAAGADTHLTLERRSAAGSFVMLCVDRARLGAPELQEEAGGGPGLRLLGKLPVAAVQSEHPVVRDEVSGAFLRVTGLAAKGRAVALGDVGEGGGTDKHPSATFEGGGEVDESEW